MYKYSIVKHIILHVNLKKNDTIYVLKKSDGFFQLLGIPWAKPQLQLLYRSPCLFYLIFLLSLLPITASQMILRPSHIIVLQLKSPELFFQGLPINRCLFGSAVMSLKRIGLAQKEQG